MTENGLKCSSVSAKERLLQLAPNRISLDGHSSRACVSVQCVS